MCWAGFFHAVRMGGGRQEFAGATALGVLTHREFFKHRHLGDSISAATLLCSLCSQQPFLGKATEKSTGKQSWQYLMSSPFLSQSQTTLTDDFVMNKKCVLDDSPIFQLPVSS